MIWTTKDVETSIKELKYVDTALIPLIPIDWEQNMKSTVVKAEFITLISQALEREYKGRVLLFPPFTYLTNESNEELTNRINNWASLLTREGVALKHIFCITSDSTWKEIENNMNETLIWLPTLPVGDVDQSYVSQLIRDQVEQMRTIFSNKWK